MTSAASPVRFRPACSPSALVFLTMTADSALRRMVPHVGLNRHLHRRGWPVCLRKRVAERSGVKNAKSTDWPTLTLRRWTTGICRGYPAARKQPLDDSQIPAIMSAIRLTHTRGQITMGSHVAGHTAWRYARSPAWRPRTPRGAGVRLGRSPAPRDILGASGRWCASGGTG